jgi:hypothetical protein
MGAGKERRSFEIRMAHEDEVALVLDFHTRYLTQHLWPRTRKDFEELAEENALYVAFETTGDRHDLIGICYIMDANEPEQQEVERFEFGGVYVTEGCRALGIASVLGRLAISNFYIGNPPKGRRMIAHVHVDNMLPRGMLKRLGFIQNGIEIPPDDPLNDFPPKSLARNDRGEVVGDLFEFQLESLAKFADWIENFSDSSDGKSGEFRLTVDLPVIQFREHAVEALRDLAGR